MNRPADPSAAHAAAPRSGTPLPPKSVLDPMDRISEVLFGLIMALTFTGAISAAEGGREEVRTLLFGAIGCNVAWGIVDGAMYLMARLGERGTAVRTARAFREAAGPAEARGVVASVLPQGISAALEPADLEALRVAVARGLATPERPTLHREDWRGALGVFLLVTVTTFPVVIPFLFARDAEPALRVSNAVAIFMLFASGWAYGKVVGTRPWATGVAMVAVGTLLVAVTMALGG